MTTIATVAYPVRAKAVALAAIPDDWDDAWDDLAAQASEPNPFYERWFLRPAIAHLTPDAGARMIAVWSGTCLVGLLPVIIVAHYGRAPIRHVENWAHYHCFYGAPLVRAGFEIAFWESALEVLDTADWASGFFHLVGIDPEGPLMRALRAVRRTDIVHCSERAMLASSLSPAAYYETRVRKKKRKEIGRLRARLDELGPVAFEALAHNADAAPWIDDFLRLEASGWKGREGSALNAAPATAAFFCEAVSGAHRSGKLELVRLTLSGQPIAMLVNFITAPGGFAFKIAFNEDYARFSPGVLIKIENLKLLARNDVDWMDSCASQDHPMINSLWAERRQIVRVTVPLAGAMRRATFYTARALETVSAMVRGKR
jgi:CelD/BcsL family acetyltransferase involved in cellulose biosynthesis